MSNGPEITPLASPAISEPWVPLWPLQPSAVGELAYAERTTNLNVTATTIGAAETFITAPAVTVDGTTPLLVEFYTPLIYPDIASPATQILIVLYLDGSSVGVMDHTITPVAGYNTGSRLMRRRLTPAAGSHTFSVRAYVNAGTGLVGGSTGGAGASLMPAFIRVSLAAPVVPATPPQPQTTELIAEIDLATTRRFTGIQAKGYDNLKLLIGGARSSAAPTNNEICMRLNDKDDANYDKTNILAWNSAVTLQQALAQTYMVIGFLPGSATPGYVAGFADISFPGSNMGFSRHFFGHAHCTASFDAATSYFVQVGGGWRYGEGIDTIELSASSSWADTFTAGTAWLYGMRGA